MTVYKKRKFILTLLVCVMLSALALLCACGNNVSIEYYVEGQLYVRQTADEAKKALPDAPIKDGKEFEGWYLDEGTWRQPFGADSLEGSDKKEWKVYAYYTDKQQTVTYTVTFNTNGGSAVPSVNTVRIESAPLTTRQGYRLTGWYFDADCTDRAEFPLDITNSLTLYAGWEKEQTAPQKFTVTFETAGGDEMSPVETDYIAYQPPANRDGYRFLGWYFDSQYNNKAEFPLTVTEDITLYALWEKITYTVTFNTNGGSTVGNMVTDYIASAPLTTKDGFDFVGWYYDSQCKNKAEFPLTVTGDMTLYAAWKAVGVTYTTDGNGTITAVSGIGGENVDIVIPSVLDGKPVTAIANNVFKENSQLRSVVIPDSVKSLGLWCFKYCTALRSVTLPSGLTSVPTGAFENCYALSEIDLPGTLQSISSDAFRMSGLQKITLPLSVKSVGQYAFEQCKSLTEVDLGNVESLSRGAFYKCEALNSIVIPDTVKDLREDNIFMSCTSLANITMPAKAMPAAYDVFIDTAYYNTPSNWTDGALYIGNTLMCVNKSFDGTANYAVKDGTLVIADHAFNTMGGGSSYVKQLRTVTLPVGLKIIGDKAFYGCQSLTSINIPSTVSDVGERALEDTALYNGASNWQNNGLYVDGWLMSVKDVPITSFEVISGTTAIADGDLFSYSNRSGVKEIILPEGLKRVGESNFYYTGIQSVTLPSTLEYIGEKAFYCCGSLTSAVINGQPSLRYIGQNSFASSALTRFEVPSCVEFVGSYAFNNIKDVTVVCDFSSKPAAWANDWAKNYNGQTSVVWAKG